MPIKSLSVGNLGPYNNADIYIVLLVGCTNRRSLSLPNQLVFVRTFLILLVIGSRAIFHQN